MLANDQLPPASLDHPLATGLPLVSTSTPPTTSVRLRALTSPNPSLGMADVSPSPSSEFDFPSLSLDAEALAQIEAVSVAAVAAPPTGRSNTVSRPQQQQHNNHAPRARGQPPPPPAVPVSDNQYSDDGFFSDTELSEEKLRELDSIMASAQTNTRPSTTSTLARPAHQNAVAGPTCLAAQRQHQPQRSMHVGPSRYGVAPALPRQANLFGGFAHLADGGRGEDDEDESHLPSSGMVRTEGKKWDRTAYAATGRRIKPVPKVDDEEEQEEEAEEEEDRGGFEQFPAPFVNRESTQRDFGAEGSAVVS